MIIDLKKTYLARIRNSVGMATLKNLYFKLNPSDESIDIAKNGALACAIFVSSILYISKLIGDIHATVKSTVKDLQKSGWQEIKEPKEGAVLIWKEEKTDTGVHQHIGFYIGNNQAVSNDSKTGTSQIHHWTFENSRLVTKIFWNNKFN